MVDYMIIVACSSVCVFVCIFGRLCVLARLCVCVYICSSMYASVYVFAHIHECVCVFSFPYRFMCQYVWTVSMLIESSLCQIHCSNCGV